MKRLIIAAAIAVSLVSATGALAHDDKNHMKKEDQHANGHAATLGKPGDPGKVTRSIVVEMNDAMRFKPDSIRVKRGETIRFIVRNTGKQKHEMVLGTIKELKRIASFISLHTAVTFRDLQLPRPRVAVACVSSFFT